MVRPTLVLLHGRNHDPASMHELVRAAGLAGAVEVVAPDAPDGSWYPDRFFAARAANEPALSQALTTVHGLLDALERDGVDPGSILLGGFSQGACLACDAVARRPRALGGLAVLCGALIGAEDERARPAAGTLAGLPVLITGTREDDWVPVDHVQASAAALRAAGAHVDERVLAPAPHELHPEEIEAFSALVRGLTSAPNAESMP